MEAKIEKLNGYFEACIEKCNTDVQRLMADERMDEANFEKVKANVYDIFRTMLAVGQKMGKGNPDEVKTFFVGKMAQIPSNWALSCDQARAHGDGAKMYIEQIKLNTVGEIREQFEKIWEDAQ